MEINNYDGVADLYDIYVPVTFDVEFFLDETKKVQGEVLELMSGTGRVSIPLLEAGVRLTCVDLSAGLNAVLEEKLHRLGLKADVIQMDVCDLNLNKQFDMVIIPFGSFAHITSPADQRQVLGRIHQHLRPGGTFICALGNPALRKQSIDGQLRLFHKYALDNDGKMLLWITEDFMPEDEQVVEATQIYEEYDASGLLTQKRMLELRFRLTPKDEIEALASETGFEIQAIYGDYQHGPFNENCSSMIWVLRKRSSDTP